MVDTVVMLNTVRLRRMRRALSVCRFGANVRGDDSRRARRLAFTHSDLVFAARARGCGEVGPPRANKRMSSHKSLRRSWRAETPGVKAVRLLQSSDQPVIGRADRPAASDAGSTQGREALLQACARGDRTALHSLYKATAPQLFGLALRMLRQPRLLARRRCLGSGHGRV
jgi:hypothetical protein